MRIIVTGSLAYDYIMNFPGKFSDHILPDKVHMLTVSFLVDSMKRLRGGTAGGAKKQTDHEFVEQFRLQQTEDHKEGVRAVAERRPGNFKGR